MVPQKPGEFRPPPVQPRFDGALRHLQHLRDLAIFQFLDIAQNDGFPQLRATAFCSAPWSNSLASRPASIPSVLADIAVDSSMRGNCSSIDSVRAFLFCASIMIDQQVARQAVQPHPKRTFARAKTLQRPKHAQEDLLRQVLRLGVGSGKAVADRIDPPCMHRTSSSQAASGHSDTAQPMEDRDPKYDDLAGVLYAQKPSPILTLD